MSPDSSKNGPIAVIGRGLLGSAAARHLAELGADVTLIGPPEPAHRSRHTGVFGSHYDSGRITRGIDRNPFYAEVAVRSIAAARPLEVATGVEFLHDVGHLTVSSMDDYLAELRAAADAHSLTVDAVGGPELEMAFSGLALPGDAGGLHETSAAGWIDPRRFIDAQCTALRSAGGTVALAQVDALQTDVDAVRLTTADGQQLTFDRVLVATGAFANQLHVLPQPIDIRVHEHTVVFGDCTAALAKRLDGMPSLILKRSDAFMDSVYVMPPIAYPDGRILMKIGQSSGRRMVDPGRQLTPWFQGVGDPEIAAWLTQELQALVPDANFADVFSDSCVTTSSPTGMPYIDTFDGGRIHTLLAGNGQVAKSADELGRIAAHRLMFGVVPSDYADLDFGLRFA